jgi:hypothetical protein
MAARQQADLVDSAGYRRSGHPPHRLVNAIAG